MSISNWSHCRILSETSTFQADTACHRIRAQIFTGEI